MIPDMTYDVTAASRVRYRIGVDVGSYSVGLCAVQFGKTGAPEKLLAATSWLHDSGVLESKTATTRLAAAGVARRMRHLRRRRVHRLRALDRQLLGWGWPEPEESSDPYDAWRARARLATELVEDDRERQALLFRALRHMARHRGWRNPFTRVAALQAVSPPSEFFLAFRERVASECGVVPSEDVSVAELAVIALDEGKGQPLRMGRAGASRLGKDRAEKAFSFLGGKLMQSDNANEIHAYGRAQGLSAELVHELILLVFAAENPKGSHVRKIGKDPLDNSPRAAKATDSFQRFRIASVIANVRVVAAGGRRCLAPDERHAVFDYLMNIKLGEQPTWAEVGKVVGLSRGVLSGTAALDQDSEERLPLRPPIYVTDQNVRTAKNTLATVQNWWMSADGERRDALVTLLIDGVHDEDTAAGTEAWELLHDLDESELAELDKLALPAGRAAYSLATLRALTQRILGSEDDLHEARKHLFGVPDDWRPPAEPIGEPIGNPSVDRVTKIVARWLKAAEREWGAPERITIEHVREAFVSARSQQDRDREMNRRFAENERKRQLIKADEKIEARVRSADLRRFEAITRQKGQCAYCGDTITYATSEMDHIVPRKGVGSTNTRTNLVAVCLPCNRSKGNQPFAAWADGANRDGVSVNDAVTRTHHWTPDRGVSRKGWNLFLRELRERLTRTDEDPEIDGRSMESVAWMANELHERVAAYFNEAGTKVSVYQGAVTAGAREAAGIADRIPFIGGGGKTRLDRRHHAVDAAVVTLLDESVARTLAERNNLRVSQDYHPDPANDWRSYSGSGPTAQRRFASWRSDMDKLAELLTDAFANDRIVVRENVRLRLANGKVHEDTIRPFEVRLPVGGAFTRDQIDAASTPALWTALTRDPGFDEVTGLPASPSRRLRVHGTHYGSDDVVALFDKPRAAIAVRGGWAELGDSIHHARIYRWEERGRTKYGMLRVFAADLNRHRHEDLFSVEPDPSWVSMRVAHPSIGRSDFSQKEYLGWLVPGDELLIDMSNLLEGHVGRASEALGLGALQRWRLTGMSDPAKLSLVPLFVAAEGVDRFLEVHPELENARASIAAILSRWRPSVDVLFRNGLPQVIRRDSLGRARLESRANLPTGWRVG